MSLGDEKGVSIYELGRQINIQKRQLCILVMLLSTYEKVPELNWIYISITANRKAPAPKPNFTCGYTRI